MGRTSTLRVPVTNEDMDGRICLVTGATSGIGEATATALARLGAHVIVVGRSAERGEAAALRISRATDSASIDLRLADLSSQSEIRRLAREVLDAYPALHVLVNNAGVTNLRREETVDGIESTFATNHLAYFLLTDLLCDRLIESAPARVVNVASHAHTFGRLEPDDWQSEQEYSAMKVYGGSKLANVLFTYELARRLEAKGVTVNCLHPGAVATRMGRNNGWLGVLASLLMKPFFASPAKGARTSVYLAASKEAEGVTGRYFVNCKPKETSERSRDAVLSKQLWDESRRLTARGGA